MFAARSNDTPRGARNRRPFCYWFGYFLLAFGLTLGSWLPAAAQAPTAESPDTVVLPPRQLHIPLVAGGTPEVAECPLTSTNSYETTPILGNPRRPFPPPYLDPDLNLLMRGYRPVSALLDLVAINGPTDDDAPQLAHLFRPSRVPTFSAVYQVHDWDWGCCPGGRLGAPIAEPEVTLVEMVTTPTEALYPPGRHATISRDFIALVLYAEQFRITFTYTREDTPAIGYVVHIENFCVDPNLLALYQEMHAEGRDDLPALRRNDSIGTARSSSILVAVRDTGSFMDPRSAKDWWQETVRMRLAEASAP